MLNLESIVTAVTVVGARVSGLMLFAPFFSSASMPPRFKVGLTLLLIWVLAPLGFSPVRAETSVAEVIAELGVGFLLGLTVQLIFEGAQLAGQLLGIQMGYSLVHVIDPQSQADTPVMGLLHQTLVLLLFLALDVPSWILRSLIHSYTTLPVGGLLMTGSATEGLLRSGGNIFHLGVQIAAPVLIATMFADIVLGFVGKASPQLPVLFVGLSVKNVVGLLVLGWAITTWPGFFETTFSSAMMRAEALLRLAH